MVEGEEKDVFRDTPVRLLGYANEVGEAFRSLVPGWVVGASYVVACGYVVADTADKSGRRFRLGEASGEAAELRRKAVGAVAADTLVWQALASVAVPGFTINRLCKLSAALLRSHSKLPPPAQKWATTLIGLAAIPFIVQPIDTGVHLALDATLRPALDIPIHYSTSSSSQINPAQKKDL